MQSARMRPLPLALEPLRVLPLVLISLLVVVAAVDVLLVLQPALILSLRNGWQHALSTGGIPTTWASLVAAGVAVAGIAVAAAVLSTFIRGVQAAPYVILAPLLVGCCTLVIGRMQLDLPVPVSPPVFAAIGTLLLIGGGSLFRSSSFLANCAGALLAAAPLALLSAGYFGIQGSHAAALHPFDRTAQMFAFVLAFASVGAPLLAIACRRLRSAAGNWAEGADELGGQIVELRERAEASEARAAESERRLSQHGGRPMLHLATDEDAVAMMRPTSGPWLRWAGWICLAVCLTGAYAVGYAPLQRRLNTQIRLNKAQVEQQAQALTALRSRFDQQRRALEQQLAAAQDPGSAAAAVVAAPEAAPPAPAAEPAKNSLAPTLQLQLAPHANQVPAEPEQLKAAPGRTIRAARVVAKAREKRHANQAVPNAPPPVPPSAAAGERAAPVGAPKPVHDDRVGVGKSNDPLEGLDGM
jgi:hypothetical protein